MKIIFKFFGRRNNIETWKSKKKIYQKYKILGSQMKAPNAQKKRLFKKKNIEFKKNFQIYSRIKKILIFKK